MQWHLNFGYIANTLLVKVNVASGYFIALVKHHKFDSCCTNYEECVGL